MVLPSTRLLYLGGESRLARAPPALERLLSMLAAEGDRGELQMTIGEAGFRMPPE
jgi:hypothetical protein